ncbi:MAG: hypothetical protein ACJ790_10115 [Myxococcaceae bacterium]
MSSNPEVASATLSACALCQTPIAEGTSAVVNGTQVCNNCAAQIQAELAAEQSTGARFPLAIAGGAIGALIGAFVWAAIVVITNFEVGYVAVLVGFLAGQGVKLGAGKGRGQTLQAAAAGLAVFGLVVSKYFIFAHFAVAALAGKGISVGYFSSEVIGYFGQFFTDQLSPFDLLWVFIAISAAYRVPAASRVAIR